VFVCDDSQLHRYITIDQGLLFCFQLGNLQRYACEVLISDFMPPSCCSLLPRCPVAAPIFGRPLFLPYSKPCWPRSSCRARLGAPWPHRAAASAACPSASANRAIARRCGRYPPWWGGRCSLPLRAPRNPPCGRHRRRIFGHVPVISLFGTVFVWLSNQLCTVVDDQCMIKIWNVL
jgi:hypothetical protein